MFCVLWDNSLFGRSRFASGGRWLRCKGKGMVLRQGRMLTALYKKVHARVRVRPVWNPAKGVVLFCLAQQNTFYMIGQKYSQQGRSFLSYSWTSVSMGAPFPYSPWLPKHSDNGILGWGPSVDLQMQPAVPSSRVQWPHKASLGLRKPLGSVRKTLPHMTSLGLRKPPGFDLRMLLIMSGRPGEAFQHWSGTCAESIFGYQNHG